MTRTRIAPALEELIAIARLAGEAVLEVYEDECAVESKADGSPVTAADHKSQAVICTELERLAPDIPIVAEEAGIARPDQGPEDAFWLVDPLDGTKEFLSHNGEFTINIGLIEQGAPVMGVVLAPALGRLFAGRRGVGALTEDGDGRRSIETRGVPPAGPTVVSSRSHGDDDALARCLGDRRVAAAICAGSSLKFCLLAAGEADLYPRFGRTMEWDTAAGDAVLRAAGGVVTDLTGLPLSYGKPGYENPHFIAHGRDSSWLNG